MKKYAYSQPILPNDYQSIEMQLILSCQWDKIPGVGDKLGENRNLQAANKLILVFVIECPFIRANYSKTFKTKRNCEKCLGKQNFSRLCREIKFK